ncbi:MAG: histidine kinase [Cytophagales bacterium]|nr:histidine kinase [Cytophagales bacterium]
MSRFFSYRLDHILFWTLTVIFHGYTRLPWIHKAGLNQFMVELIVRNGLLACAIYLTISVAIPHLTNGKKAVGILGIVVALCLYVLGKNAHDVYFYGYVMGDPERLHFFYNTFYNFSIVTFYLAFATTLYLSKLWYLQREKMRQIEMEKLNTELEYLRAQINPHFLFNSINTIYFQIDKQNTHARETLEKFSEMLRYQLYECTSETIAIEREIHYLQNYVALQKLRLGQHQVELKTDESLQNFFIPPLVLIPFVENAFKHVSHFTNKPNEIKIELLRKEKNLNFNCFNTTETVIAKSNGGIGLKNVARRLELLFGGTATLKVERTENAYTVSLQIPIM